MGSGSDHGATPASTGNLLQLPDGRQESERFDDVLRRPGVRVERIISHGHRTPADAPYVQDWDEWVLILEGAAELYLEGMGQWTLARGDHLLIPAGVPHLVTHTADPTIWLAIHVGDPG